MKMVAFEAWLAHPFFGVGIDNYFLAWGEAATDRIPPYFQDFLFTNSQSTYLTLLAGTGFLGFPDLGSINFCIFGRYLATVEGKPGKALEFCDMGFMFCVCNE